MKKLLYYLSPHYPRMSVGLAIKTVGTVVELFIPWILGYIVDSVLPTKDRTAIYLWGGAMLLLAAVAVSFNIIANRMASAVAREATRKIRHDLFAKISYLDAADVDRLSVSSLESRLTGDTYNVNHMIGMMQRLGVRAPILLLGGITVTFLQDVRLTLVMVATLPFIALSVYIISKKGIPLFTEQQRAVDGITRVVRENASGVRIIKALGKSDYEKERFDRVNQDAIRREKKAGLTMSATNPLITFFLNAGLAAVIVVGAHLVNGGLSDVGKIMAFLSYFTMISNALLAVSRMFTMLSKGMAGMGRISEVLDMDPTLYVPETAGEETHPSPFRPDDRSTPVVEFRNVTFSFGERVVLKNISFALYEGQTLGMIGATGSGKSTVIALLLRIYAPDSGEILLSGTPIEKIPTPRLREKIGVVFQNDFLFADTIRENASFGRDVPADRLAVAYAHAQAEYVANYPEGDGHLLEIKGANLSGGQKQRLLIARALAGEPDLLILDDSSSALDYKTDARLRATLRKEYGATTTVLVAQRISSIAHADLILMLEGGEIIGRGDHDHLLRTCAPYKEIADTQMGGMTLAE
ncbi:MAG: ABC transporter ATP-binding protein [Clostridia bacterium]|nr:ABC transporter ATP-binding protein [Clostridia bacterium]